MHKRNLSIGQAGALLLMTAGIFFALPAAAADKGCFGLEVSIEADGSNSNPTIHSVTIQKVAPDSPAAQAALAAGDVILSADGMPLPGIKTDALRAAMARQVGETLHLTVRRGGDVRTVTMVAVHAPASG